MRAILNLSAGVALAIALAGCNSRNGDNVATSNGASTSAMPTEMTATNEANMADDMAAPMMAPAFVDAAAASDMFEVESSKLAMTKGKSAAVKNFATMMVADHTKSTTDLKAAAAKATPAVTVVPKMTAQQQSDLDGLKNAGADFDVMYSQKQVVGHEKALAMLRDYAARGNAPALKDFAGKTAPVVAGHLDEARQLPK
jgi:putative membrane protein